MTSHKYGGSLDTNVAIRILLNDIPDQHQKSLKLIQESNKEYLVSDIAIMEIVFVLEKHYGFTREQIADTVTGLMNIWNLVINRGVISESIGFYLSHKSLSFEDCYMAETARFHNAEPLYTFDRKLAARSDVAQELV